MSESVMVRMWPTPAVPNGGRKAKSGTLTATGITADGRKQQMSLESAVTMEYAEPHSSQLTLFAEAFPVSPIVSPADAAPPPTTATSGPSSPDLFASCDPDGSWRKTYPDCSPVRLDGSSVPFSETWPRAGMTRSGIAYQLAPSARLTDATACGSWPTPCAEDAKNVPYQKGDHGVRYPMLLGAVAPERMWPTPSANEDAVGTVNGRMQFMLTHAAKLWPTPASRDYRSPSLKVGTPEYFRAPTAGIPLPEAIGGQLNPTWVEWLMGYPLGWTACAASGTRSSRKSRSTSPAASSPPKG